MPLAQQTATARRITAQSTLDASTYISIEEAHSIGQPGGEGFFAILEPLVNDPASDQTARLVIERLRQEIVTRKNQTPTAALADSVEAVNLELFGFNEHQEQDQRLFYGITCGISRGEDLYIAQVSPSQILISQDNEVYAFPSIQTWRRRLWDDTADAFDQPLGLYEGIDPELYHTRIAEGDLIVLASPALARVIEREPQDVFTQGDIGLAIDHLDELASDYAVDNCLAAVIGIAPAEKSNTAGATTFLRRLSLIIRPLLPEHTARQLRFPDQSPTYPLDPQEQSGHTLDHPAVKDAESAISHDDHMQPFQSGRTVEVRYEDLVRNGIIQEERYPDDDDSPRAHASTFTSPANAAATHVWHPLSERIHQTAVTPDEAFEYEDEHDQTPPSTRKGRRTLTEIIIGACIALVAFVVGIWQLAINRDQPIDDERDDSTVGLPRLQRYDSRVQGPDFSGLRRRLPRAPISRMTGIVSIGLILAVASGLAFSVYNGREQERVDAFEGYMDQAIQSRQQASEASNPVTAAAFLDSAENRLNQAAEIDHEPERIAAEQTAIAMARDEALGIERLSNVQLLGGIPPAPEGVTPRLFTGNGQIFVFTDALYRLDSESNRLVQLLGTGQSVGGTSVGTLLGASWGDGRAMATDGSNLFILDPTAGDWVQHDVGNFGEPYSEITDISGYIGNLYMLLSESGQIVSYQAGGYNQLPEDWTSGQAMEELTSAVDMEIDGRIFVLLSDGRVLNFFRGALEETYESQTTPEIAGALSLSIRADDPHYYVADARGRIIRYSSNGEFVQQFQPAEDMPSFDGVRDVLVNDALGTAWVMTDNQLIEARLPGPPRE